VPGQTCQDNADCTDPAFPICDDRDTCVPEPTQTCTDHAQCPDGQYCSAQGICEDSDTCTSHGECTRPGLEFCDARGTCIPTPNGEQSCTDSNGCDVGQECVDGFCRDKPAPQPGDQCQFDQQCYGGLGICVNGECHAPCNGPEDCATGQDCQAGFCWDVPNTTDPCVHNTDCEAGEICIDTVCHPGGCQGDTDCTNPEDRCVDGACVPDTRPQPECTQNPECSGGQHCVEGVCRTACTVSDPDCVACGMPVCHMGYCFDAVPECVLNSECQAGENCADAQCVPQ
jgi:hypothetical protein